MRPVPADVPPQSPSTNSSFVLSTVKSYKANRPIEIHSLHSTMGHVAHRRTPSPSSLICFRDVPGNCRPALPYRIPSNSQTHGSMSATPPAVCPLLNTFESPPARFQAKSSASRTTPPGLPRAMPPSQECSAPLYRLAAATSPFPPQIPVPIPSRTVATSPYSCIHTPQR